MDPRHLTSDELEYELVLRGFDLHGPSSIDRLRQAILHEADGTVDFPIDSGRATRNNVTQELQECERKWSEVQRAIREAEQSADSSLVERGQSRIVHLTQRVGRLQHRAPEHSAVERLMARVRELDSHVGSMRDSLGAGELSGEGAMAEQADVGVGDDQLLAHRPQPQHRQQVVFNTAGPAAAQGVGSHVAPGSRMATPSSFEPQTGCNAVDLGRMSANQNQRLEPIVRGFFNNAHPVPTHDHSRFQANPFGQQQAPPPNNRSFVPIPANHHAPAFNGYAQHRPDAYVAEQAAPIPQRSGYGQQAGNGMAGGHNIHKWSLRFDGSSNGLDAADFIFRLERQAQLYGVAQRALVIGIGELLTGRAAQWYWTYQRQAPDAGWDGFRRAFMRRYAPHQDTDFEIRAKMENRWQRQGESFSDYCQDVEAMAIRLVRAMQDDELVEVLRRNMSMQLQTALWQTRTRTVDELLEQCNAYERVLKEGQRRSSQRQPMRLHEVSQPEFQGMAESPNMYAPAGEEGWLPEVEALKVAGNRQEYLVCWNCDDMGHAFSQCRKQQNSVFCFTCGLKGEISATCPKCSLNPRRGQLPATARSSQTAPPQLPRHPTAPKPMQMPMQMQAQPKVLSHSTTQMPAQAPTSGNPFNIMKQQ